MMKIKDLNISIHVWQFVMKEGPHFKKSSLLSVSLQTIIQSYVHKNRYHLLDWTVTCSVSSKNKNGFLALQTEIFNVYRKFSVRGNRFYLMCCFFFHSWCYSIAPRYIVWRMYGLKCFFFVLIKVRLLPLSIRKHEYRFSLQHKQQQGIVSKLVK